MTDQAHFLGVAIDAHGLSLVLLDKVGQEVGVLRRGFGKRSGEGRHDPQDWWRTLRTATKELLRRSGVGKQVVRGVGLAGTGDGPVLLDAEGKVLNETWLGAGGELAGAVAELRARVGERTLLNLSGGLPEQACLAVQLLWLREQEQRAWHDCSAILQPRDFLRFRLTGERIGDPGTASRSLLLSPRNRAWSRQLCKLLEIEPRWLVDIQPGNAIGGRITPQAAREIGLQAGTPLAVGADQHCATAIALGAMAAGDGVIELGGEGSFLAITDQPLRDADGRLRCGCHPFDELWTLDSRHVVSSQGPSWLMSELLSAEVQQARRNKREPLDQLSEYAAETPPGADGLLFLNPVPEQDGAFIGLGRRHGRGHVVRAVLEGGVLAAADIWQHAQALGAGCERLIATGPGAANTLWCQMLADALGREVQAVPLSDGAAIGAGLLAGYATGAIRSLDKAGGRRLKGAQRYQPRLAAQKTYAERLPERRRLLEAMLAAGNEADMVGGRA